MASVDKRLEAKRAQARAIQDAMRPMSPETIAQDTMRSERAAMDRAAGLTLQDVRDLAGDVLPYATTGAGTAIGGMVGGPAGMVAGGAVGASMGARGRQLLRGDPELTTAEKATEIALGAASGVLGAGLGRLFAVRPHVNLSAAMQEQARAVDKAFIEQAKAAGVAIKRKAARGFVSPRATEIWKRSEAVAEIERAVQVARGRPDAVRQQFQKLANSKLMRRRLAPEQHALLLDVTRQNTAAGILRSVGELSQALKGTTLTAATSLATGGGVGAAGRALDKAATGAAVNRALTGISELPIPPAVPNLPLAGAGAAAGQLLPRPDLEREALIQELQRRR